LRIKGRSIPVGDPKNRDVEEKLVERMGLVAAIQRAFYIALKNGYNDE